MGDPRRYDLALLFSLAAVPIAGCSKGFDDAGDSPFSSTAVGSSASQGSSAEDDDGDSEGGEEGTDDGPSDGSITDPSPGDGGSDPSMTSADSGDPSGASTDPSGASMTGASTYGGSYGSYGTYGGSYGGTYGGGMVPPVCQQFAAHYSQCAQLDESYLAQYCAYDLQYGAMMGAQCGAALEEYYACMSMADCEELASGDPCGGEQLAGVCGGGSGG